jgi:Glyoxalase-like domain
MSAGGRHPTGTENSNAHFENETYLELMGLYDPAKDAYLSAFLDKHEGGISIGLNTRSAERTAAFLKSRGVDSKVGDGTIKFEGMEEAPPVFWRWVEIREGTFLSDAIFLIEYTPARMMYRKNHPERYGPTSHQNTAKNISSVWIAVRDVEEAGKRLEHIGLAQRRTFNFPRMSAKGVEFEAGEGSIVLLSPSESKGKALRFLAQRGEGVIGAGIQVASLAACKETLQKSGRTFEENAGIHSEALIIEPEQAHGVYLEMFQTPRKS